MSAVRPIIFSAPMVRAILVGHKTQTRRVLKPQPVPCAGRVPGAIYADDFQWPIGKAGCSVISNKPHPPAAYLDAFPLKWSAGDHLWIRETWASVNDLMHNRDDIIYRADGNAGWRHGWRPSIHMPRWASRITLEVTEVRVERLQDISKADALAEGALEAVEVGYIGSMTCDQARQAFAELWDDLHKHRPGSSWDDNPWVAVICFRVAQP